jgi:hypothetical protein
MLLFEYLFAAPLNAFGVMRTGTVSQVPPKDTVFTDTVARISGNSSFLLPPHPAIASAAATATRTPLQDLVEMFMSDCSPFERQANGGGESPRRSGNRSVQVLPASLQYVKGQVPIVLHPGRPETQQQAALARSGAVVRPVWGENRSKFFPGGLFKSASYQESPPAVQQFRGRARACIGLRHRAGQGRSISHSTGA